MGRLRKEIDEEAAPESSEATEENQPPSALPRIALLVETQIIAGRDMLDGVARYVRESGPWELHLEPRMQQFVEGWEPRWLRNWKGNGIIARFVTQSVVSCAKSLGVPAVDVLGVTQEHKFPLVKVDDAAVGRMAAEHLLGRGFKQFGFVGLTGQEWSDQRQDTFAKTVGQHGYACSVLQLKNFYELAEEWDEFIERTARWIQQLPKPLGLMICYDQIGPPVTQACRRVGVSVPEEVAMIGCDNDGPVCAICNPPLTSVNPNHEEVGYQAAALLDRLMAGEPAPQEPILVPPKNVVVRQSSEVSAIEDPIVSAALSMIRERACNGLRVRELAERSPVSEPILQKRFHAVVGRSVHEEIVRVQLRKAQELLRDTELPIRTVAEKTGFKHQEYMGAVFKTRLGLTPGQFRRRYQKIDTPDPQLHDPLSKSAEPR